MRNVFNNHRLFFIIYAIFILITAVFLVSFQKQEIHLYLNSLNSSFFDVFFKYITYLGDGVTIAIVGVGALFLNKRMGFQILGSGILSGIVAQLLKKQVFGSMVRPSKYFDELNMSLHYVEGVKLHGNFSFPSGHTTAAFALVTSLLLIQKSNKWDVGLILMGVIIGFSRVYLSQHFLVDIFAGSIFGTAVAVSVHLFLNSTKMMARKGLDKPLINFSTKRS